MAEAVRLCALDDIADGAARLFETEPDRAPDIFVVRKGARAFCYVNDCPHQHLPLDFVPGRFLDLSRRHILCTNHGAWFEIETGACLRGPCRGERLCALAVRIEHGAVWLDGGAPVRVKPGQGPG
ncbi:MAG TPA: Rieske (2Fe-2S) protein [Alphaproteobacteria bacterium]